MTLPKKRYRKFIRTYPILVTTTIHTALSVKASNIQEAREIAAERVCIEKSKSLKPYESMVIETEIAKDVIPDVLTTRPILNGEDHVN